MPNKLPPTEKFYKYRYPNYAQDLNRRLEPTYVYEDDPPEDESRKRIYQSLWGGLRGKLTSPYYIDQYLTEQYPELRRMDNCFKTVISSRNNYTINDKRAHFRVLVANSVITFIPLLYKPFLLPSHFGRFMWALYSNFTRTDKEFLNDTRLAYQQVGSRIDVLDIQLEGITISPNTINSRYLDADVKHSLNITLAQLVWKQNNLKYVIFENAQFILSDGLTFLLIFAIGAGQTIKELNLWHFFKSGLLPVPENNEVFCEYDYFHYHREEDIRPSVTLQEEIIKKVILETDLSEIPAHLCAYYYKLSLIMFENLSELWIHYAWLAGGQGKSLCQLGAVKFKKLKYLHLLYGSNETVKDTQQLISRSAWKYVLKNCPDLQLSITMVGVLEYNHFKPIVTDNLPLVEFNMMGGMIFSDVSSYKPLWLDCIFRSLIFHYMRSLKRISLQFWRPHQLMDLSIGKLLTRLPVLEEFEYQGQIDKSDTICKICEFLLSSTKTRLKRVHILLHDDPCAPENWEIFVTKVNEKFKKHLASKGIDFLLEVFKV